MKFSNVGGSLGNGAALLLVLWSVHCWRRFKRDRASASPKARPARKPRFVGSISARALEHLVQHAPVLHCVIDLRTPEESAAAPLPDAFQPVTVVTTVSKLGTCLKSVDAWRAAFPHGPAFPTPGHLLIFVTLREPLADVIPLTVLLAQEHMAQAAAAAALGNFQRCLRLAAPFTWGQSPAEEAAFINRDACAYLLSLQQQKSAPQDFVFVDLRRSDERAMYGGIPGSVHIPVETFIFAVQQDARGFEAVSHAPRPPLDEPLILQCRSNRRSAWAALIAAEHGYSRVFVYKQGSYGWRIDPGVKSYASYELSDYPPEPEDLPLETVDGNTAVEELKALGIIPT